MCCFLLALMFGGPRLGFLIWWLVPAGQIRINQAFDTWFWPLLGLVFLPWTTLTYSVVYGANGMLGFDWVWVGIALFADIVTYTSGAYKRKAVPGYPQSAP